MSYQVGVDVGGTFTTAAVVRGGRAEVVKVMPSRLPGVPQGFLRRVGDDTPVLVGARPVPAETLVAQLVTQIVSAVGRPARLAVTHPVTWGPHRVAALRAALGEVTMLSTAAAVAYQSTAPTAVHDLGGTTFTAAVVHGLATVGQPAELDLGGADLDELVFGHVCAALDAVPADPAELARLRQACTTAKETLSADTEVEIPVAGTRIRLTRAEFEELARPLLTETAVALRLAIEESGVTPAKVLLAGGAAWLPLLTQVVSEELGRPVAATPPGAAAMGAALAAAGMPVNQPAAVRDQLGAAGGVPLGRAPRANQPTRLAVRLEPLPPNDLPGPRALLSPAGNGVRTSIVEPVRPPVPVAAAPVEARSRRPRTMVVAAAAVFAVLGSAAALALGSGQAPAGAGADTMPPASTVTETVPVTTTEAAAPPVDTPARRTQQPQPTGKKTQPTTTTTRPAPTTTTTTAPASTPPTTTTSRTTNSRSTQTSGGGDR
jgi:molecular chaperone DnaK